VIVAGQEYKTAGIALVWLLLAEEVDTENWVRRYEVLCTKSMHYVYVYVCLYRCQYGVCRVSLGTP
jgi:hypothetical protein